MRRLRRGRAPRRRWSSVVHNGPLGPSGTSQGWWRRHGYASRRLNADSTLTYAVGWCDRLQGGWTGGDGLVSGVFAGAESSPPETSAVARRSRRLGLELAGHGRRCLYALTSAPMPAKSRILAPVGSMSSRSRVRSCIARKVGHRAAARLPRRGDSDRSMSRSSFAGDNPRLVSSSPPLLNIRRVSDEGPESPLSRSGPFAQLSRRRWVCSVR